MRDYVVMKICIFPVVLFLFFGLESAAFAAAEAALCDREAMGIAQEGSEVLGKKMIDAVKAGNEREVEFLIKEGVSVNTQDESGRTLLQVSVECNRSKGIIKALLTAGAQVNDLSSNGVPVLVCAMRAECRRDKERNARPHASKFAIYAIQLERCLSPGSAGREFSQEATPCSRLKDGGSEVVRMLILAGADIYLEFKNERGSVRTPLNYACDLGLGEKVLQATQDRMIYESRLNEISSVLADCFLLPEALGNLIKGYEVDDEFTFLEERQRYLKK